MKKQISKYKIPLIFGIFFLLVLFQHQFLHLYHDDYGYASLSYAYNLEGANGHSNSLTQIIQFLGGHYNVWGGRILFFLIECIILNLSLPLFRIVQSIIITLIFYLVYKITYMIIKKHKEKIALLSCTCYGLIQFQTFKSGIFWVTASVLYVFPVLFMFLFIYFHNRKTEKKNNIIKNILLCITIFFATFSQEQTAIAMLIYIIGMIGYKFITTKKIEKENIFYLISSLCGFAILMLSPGNAHRMERDSFYQLGLLGKLTRSIPDILANIYGKYDRIIIFLVIIVSIGSVYKLLTNKKYNSNKKINFLLSTILISDIVMAFISLFEYDGYYWNVLMFTSSKALTILLIIFQTLLLFIPIFIYLYHKKQPILIILLFAAICSQGVMIITSYYPLRSMLIFDFIFFIIFIEFFFDITNNIKISNYLLIIPLLFVGLFNYYYTTDGFYTNHKVNIANDKKLCKIAEEIKNGKKVEKITLKKMKNDWFAGEMPYHENFDYIATYIKNYYKLPQNIKLEYK